LRPSSATQPYSGALRLCGVPRANRLLKAIAGSGFEPVLCADVYNLYVKRNISHGGCIFAWQLFQHRIKDSGNLNISNIQNIVFTKNHPTLLPISYYTIAMQFFQDWLEEHFKRNRRDEMILFTTDNVLTPIALQQVSLSNYLLNTFFTLLIVQKPFPDV
jgi:hypothetical protein